MNDPTLPRFTEIQHWLLAIVLILPATLPCLRHCTIADGTLPTGFIQGDQHHYMAVAREHFDNGAFELTYANPFSGDYNSPRLYCQPPLLLLGVVWRLTLVEPGLLYMLAGLCAALVCVRMMTALYEAVVGLATPPQLLGLLLFVWGGGVLALAGMLVSIVYGFFGGHMTFGSIFQFDPMSGWWFLNPGRNLVLPTEAFYHALFFAAMTSLVTRRFALAAACACILSLSHPYTGSELLAILFLWSFAEVILAPRGTLPGWFFVTCALLLLLHLGYYLVFLRRFPEHQSILAQWDQPWFLRPETMILAYLPVLVCAAWVLRRLTRVAAFLSAPANRLLAVWCLVAAALSNHELFMHPVEPLHFDRGYVWASLFLIGAPALTGILEWLLVRQTLVARAGLVALVLLFLGDNALWLGGVNARGVRTTADEKELMTWLGSPEFARSVVLSPDEHAADLATVYTPLRSWYANSGITPFSGARKKELDSLFLNGVMHASWASARLTVILPRSQWTDSAAEAFARRAFAGQAIVTRRRNPSYSVFLVVPP